MRRALLLVAFVVSSLAAQHANLLPDPSIEETQPPNQFGIPYKRWGGWKFEGQCEFRNGKLARGGKTCAELVGGGPCKLRLSSPAVTVEPGRYRFSCWVRGLDIGEHPWRLSEDFVFADDKYYPLRLKGTFGWRRIELVKEVAKRQEVVARIGLWAAGRLWVDDAELVRVADTTPLTPEPVVGAEEEPIAPPGKLDPAKAVPCPDCGYRNLLAWGDCYACGEKLVAPQAVAPGPPVKPLCSFENGKSAPFGQGTVVAEHASDGQYALRIDKDWASWDGDQDWTGYDFLAVDVFNPSDDPQQVYIEVRDRGTTGYWTRVNYLTTAPPGASKVLMPTDIYVGEKSRPGRPLDKAGVRRLVLSIGESRCPLYFDHVRLERDTLAEKVSVPGLRAYNFGPAGAPAFRGFTPVTPGTTYSAGRGYGLRDARIWRSFDALQPDPLYESFICVEAGAFVVDLPNGRWHVFINLDSPSGFWGEVQRYRKRVLKANGTTVVDESMGRESFLRRYYRFAESEDRLDENTFDKYQRPYFSEKEFDVDVRDGQLALAFTGENWAHCVSAVVMFPAEQAEQGRAWLANLRERRRFWFDNYFKRIAPNGRKDADGPIPALAPTPAEQAAGYVVFSRDWMRDVPCNGVPRRAEVTRKLEVAASAGELEPIVFSLYPLRDAGEVTVSVSDLVGPQGKVPSEAVRLGVVSHRLSRVTMEGTVYTIAPRFVMPRKSATLRAGTTTTFWLTLVTPNPVAAGEYAGKVTLTFADGRRDSLDLSARLFATPLAEADAPIGPWGCTIGLPWYSEELGDYPRTIYRRCLAKMREAGCTTFSDIPRIRLTGWRDGQPQFDFREADQQMADARAAGFRDLVVSYGAPLPGFDNYRLDPGAAQRAGLKDFDAFLRAMLAAVETHARAANWLPVAWNLCDEPIGAAIADSAANARAWRAAAPADMLTTGATSIASPKPDDPHLPLVKALKVANLNHHDEPAVRLIQEAGSDWAFYNNGDRWTLGTYFYKCVQQYGCRFRLSWHWNCAAGDPFYALDCREDDYAWCVTNAAGELIPALTFERDVREGIDDYRYLLTLARRVAAKPNQPAAAAGRKLLDDTLASFKLGETRHGAKWPTSEFARRRRALALAIEALG